MQRVTEQATTLVALLRRRAEVDGSKLAYVFREDDDTDDASITYAKLDRKAQAIAAELVELGATGERALLLYPAGLEFIAAFFGCLYAGVTAIPVTPPRLNRPVPRIAAIVQDADARYALSTGRILDSVEKRLEHQPLLGALNWRDTERIGQECPRDCALPDISPDGLAFLQYTSGSTSAPKGVMVTHANVMINMEMIRHAFRLSSAARGVFWLPSYHDMGLIGAILEPMYVAGPSMLMSPVAFLQRPARWLQNISEFRATITGAPNFAYDLCVDKVADAQKANLDLSSLKLCFVGAEPVRPATLARFTEAFAPCGFRETALYPCYGLAEATLLVSGGDGPGQLVRRRLDREALQSGHALPLADDPFAQEFIGSGKAMPGEQIRIVDPDSLVWLPDGTIGEVWVSGGHIAAGYWRCTDLSAHTFKATIADSGEGPFLRTGDLGFLSDGELIITGRLKDLIIIRGKSHYPQDIEESFAGAHEAVKGAAAVAFAYERDSEERLAIVAEVNRRHLSPDIEALVPILRAAIAENHGIEIDAIVLVKSLTIPRTSSGKIQRHLTRQRFLDGTLTAVGVWQAAAETFPWNADATGSAPDQRAILTWLVRRIAYATHSSSNQVDPDESFAVHGIDSLQAVSLTGELEDFLGRTLSPTLVFDYPTPRQLASFLSGAAAPRQVERPVSETDGADTGFERVAIVGMACRFPGAQDTSAFWNLLANGVDAIEEIPADRFNVAAFFDPAPCTPGKLHSPKGGFLGAIDQFDAEFFGISPREAAAMDPQQRQLLEVSWEALESAGIRPSELSGTSTGVFVGISSFDYCIDRFGDPDSLDIYATTGSAHSIAANRLSYFYDLRGPSVAIDTACSSSLVAVHTACRSLLAGESDLALAGGVNLILSPEITVSFSKAGIMAPDGRCKTFDAAADGYARGEGCAMVFLKRLSEAIRDDDPILAVICGSAANHDGRSNGLTAPSGPSQEAVLIRALEAARLHPHEIDYVEAHGTGTRLGDPIELNALRNVLDKNRPAERPLFVGSVKTNIGHLEAAAGIAGLVKTVLSLRHETIPRHLHLKTLNPYISLGGTRIEIPIHPQRWRREERPRFAGVSSFGFGGTNAHVILSEAPIGAMEPAGELERPPERSDADLWLFSARSQRSLLDLLRRASTEAMPSLRDVAFTSQVGRDHFEHRRAVVANTIDEAGRQIERMIAETRETDLAAPGRARVLAFLFPGQGSQYPGMARRLYVVDPTFRRVVNECAELARDHLDIPLHDLILDTADTRIQQTRYGQIALFTVEYALAAMWRAWGIEPAYLLGHSVGEWTAACVADAVSLEDAIRVVSLRGRLMDDARNTGGMLTVGADEAEVAEAISELGGGITIAALNGPGNVTVSGDLRLIEKAAAIFDRRCWAFRALKGLPGFHSQLMDPVLEEFRTMLNGVRITPPQIPIAANVDGILRTSERPFEADYWVRHIRETVRFADGVEVLAEAGVDTLIETGPPPTLLKLTRRILRDRKNEAHLLPSLDQRADDWETVLTSLGRLYELGVEVDWRAFNRERQGRITGFPHYPFQRERLWLERSTSATLAANASAVAEIDPRRLSPIDVPIFERQLDRCTQVGLLDLILSAAKKALGSSKWFIRQVRFEPIPDECNRATVQTVFNRVSERRAAFSVLLRSAERGMLLANGELESGWAAVRDADLESENGTSQQHQSEANGATLKRPEPANGIRSFVHSEAARILGTRPGGLPSDIPLNLLGLDSLMAVELGNAVKRKLGVEIPIAHLIEGRSLDSLIAFVEDRMASTRVRDEIPIHDGPGPHPLTYGQRAMWLLRELAAEDSSFNIAEAVRIVGDFDVDRLRRALKTVMRRHLALTTRLYVVDGAPVQEPGVRSDIPLIEIDARQWPAARIDGYLRQEAWRKFRLATGPPFRVRVLRLPDAGNERAHLVLLSIDHIVSDFWSVSLIVRDLIESYTTGGAEDGSALRYVDVVRWLNRKVEAPEAEAHLKYWREQLAGNVPNLNLPTDRPRPRLHTYAGRTLYRRLPETLAQRLSKVAEEQGTTMFNVLLAAFQALLYRYSGRETIVVGSVMAGRDHPDLADLVGYLINPVALKSNFSGDPTFLELLREVRTTVLEAFEHQSYPLLLLAEKLDLPRNRSRPPLFETMFIFQKAQVMDHTGLSAFAIGMPGSLVRMGELKMQIHPLDGHPAQFDLTLMMAEAEGTLLASLNYNLALFDEATVERMLAHLETLLAGIAADPAKRIADYPLVSPKERAQVYAWNRSTRRDFPVDMVLPKLIARGAAMNPEKAAVICSGRSMSYVELEMRSNRLAAHLQSLGVGPDRPVGVCMRRSLELPTALLGILKAGGAYVPLDPSCPRARIDFMVADSGLDVVLADEQSCDLFPDHVRVLDTRFPGIAGETGSSLQSGCLELQPNHLAYVVYTSGSTGEPKGVRISHRAVANFLQAMLERPGLSADDVLYAVTTLSFDISVLELFLPLVAGATVVIAADETVRNASEMMSELQRTGSTVMQATPSTWRLLLEAGWQGSADLKVLCGGETMSVSLAEALLPRCRELWNMYGPTETTVWSTALNVGSDGGLIENWPVGLGTPIANTAVHILDRQLEPVPLGVVGELCIEGAGLSDGYVDRPELDREKFVELVSHGPSGAGASTRVYRTGDLARLRTDGSLEFAGRFDSQVKLRGYRIELGEIEAMTTQCPGVRQAVAAVQAAGDETERLVGFVVPEKGAILFELDLRRWLGRFLPEHMIPARFVILDALPLTPKGKIDRRALPRPSDARPELPVAYVAPRNELETQLVVLCADALGLERERVGVRDDFFDLGGTSLQATRFMFRVREAFRVQIPLRSLFEDPTIEKLARAIEKARELSGAGSRILRPKSVVDLLADVVLDHSIKGNGRTWKSAKPARILLTGAAGYLGAFLLRELLDETQAEITCLVRADTPAEAMARLRGNLLRHGQRDDTACGRIVALPGALDRPALGLKEAELSRLEDEVDVIYHNGAMVNFIQTYEEHKPANVGGTTQILRLAASRRLKPVHFVSTLSVFYTGRHTEDRIYRETEELEDTGAPLGGYSQSKWVGEKLVQLAVARGVPAAIYRPGYISGHSETGTWNNTDLVWGLARACLALGKVPDLVGPVDVVPVDYVSRAIVRLSLTRVPDGRIYHLGNPKTYPYLEMVSLLQRLGLSVDLVPFDDWREILFRHAMEGHSGEWNAFLPIIEEVEFQRIWMPAFDSTNTVAGLEGSGISCPPVGPELLTRYLESLQGRASIRR